MATYYIDYKNGNDTTGTGATGAPWKTITKALTVIGNGDTLKLRGDSADNTTWYRERGMTISETSFTIEADTGHTPTLVGSVEYTAWAATGGTTNVYETTFTAAACWAVWNGATKLATAASVAACDATPNSRFFDDPGNKLHVNIGGAAPTSIEVYEGGNGYALIVTGTGFTARNLLIQYQMQALDVRVGSSTLSGCTSRYWVDYSPSEAFGFVQLDGDTHAVSGCSFYGGGTHPGVTAKATASNASIATSTFDSCQVLILGGSGHVVDECDFTWPANGDGVSTYTATATWSLTVRNCTFHDCGHAAIVLGSATVEGTATIYRNTVTFSEINAYGRHGIVCHNCGGALIYHNVFYGDVAGALNDGLYFAPLGGTALTVTAYNNAFENSKYGMLYVSGTVTYTDLDYSCFYNSATANYQLIAAGDQGTHDVTADPLFTNAATHDFTLQAASPCRNTGVVVAGINDGTGGSTRFGGAAPDIGYWEYPELTGGGMLLLGVG